MIEIDFTLRVAGREALQAGSNGEDPWEASLDLASVPAHDSWVWIPGLGGSHPPVRARACHAEHLHFYPSRSVRVLLVLESISKVQAYTIGVEWHPWMMDTTRDEFAQHREMRAKRGADDGA